MATNRIPDSMLSKFTCSKCNRYVTMAPIAVEDDGQISCGKCTDWTTPKVRCSLLESLATLYSFPCKYKHAGCPVYLTFNETIEHESSCVYHTFPCPTGFLIKTNGCKWDGTITGMLRHYKRQHPQFTAEFPNFKITLEDEYEKYYLIEVDHILLLLQIKSSTSEGKLWFNAVYIGQPENANLLRYRINLSCKDVSKQVISLQTQPATSVDYMKMDLHKSVEISKKSLLDILPEATYIFCTWNIYVYTDPQNIIKIDDDIESTEDDEELHLVEAKTRNTHCPNCNILMVPPIYRCETGSHVTCGDCKGYYNKCKTCQKNELIFKRADDLERISELKYYTCRWTACTEVFTYLNIRSHEQQCTHRIFHCPKCNVWSGDKESLFTHFKSIHPKTRLYTYNPFFFNIMRFIPGFIFVHNELFSVDIESDFRKRFVACNLSYLGLPSESHQWDASLFIKNGRRVEKFENQANVLMFKSLPSFVVNYHLTIEKKETKKNVM